MVFEKKMPLVWRELFTRASLGRSGASKQLAPQRWRSLRAFASSREMGFLIRAAVLAKAQRRKGSEGGTPLLRRHLILKDHKSVSL